MFLIQVIPGYGDDKRIASDRATLHMKSMLALHH
jgi:hypothetical protein